MTTTQLIEQEVHRLDEGQQVRVLEFARALVSRPAGVRLQDLRQMTGTFTHEDLAEIEKAIEDDCEKIDAQSW